VAKPYRGEEDKEKCLKNFRGAMVGMSVIKLMLEIQIEIKMKGHLNARMRSIGFVM
jgi:hypothetical protein